MSEEENKYCILCIVLYALYSMHCTLCIVLHALYYMHFILCIVFYVLYSLCCILCIVLNELCSLNCNVFSKVSKIPFFQFLRKIKRNSFSMYSLTLFCKISIFPIINRRSPVQLMGLCVRRPVNVF